MVGEETLELPHVCNHISHCKPRESRRNMSNVSVRRETIVEALERWAKVQPHKLAWQFHSDKLEIEDTYTYQVREAHKSIG